MQAEQLKKLEQSFRRFAAEEFHGYTPLYEALARDIADDRDLLQALFAEVGHRPVVVLLLLGSVHFLLLKSPNDPLASYYPSITEHSQPPGEAYPDFRAFCLKHLGEIKAMLRDRRVQTNEVQRCACLLPCFGLVSSRSGGKPLAMVEIGTSAGLHLLWDRYRYDYGEGHIYGSPASSVLIKCELRGEERVPLPDLLPYVSMRTGIDLNPLDVR
ncbi:MAG TPA: DUF2332 domain-containing protein, partial [Chloroflexia bacterium]|nr:DUF2332 domain-containing protein [Chloroflexia bacterium]